MKITAPNLKITVGSETELWNKVMKEVKEKHYAGPFEEIPFEDGYIQSLIRLVPKDQGKRTRLIFHLSYPRGDGTSVNANTPKELCFVKYPDFSDAVKLCLRFGKGICYCSKSDWRSAFRQFPLRKECWRFLVMKVKDLKDGRWYYFVDKCMPFGSSISCAHFQAFSNAISHVMKYRMKHDNVNCLDNFLFVALLRWICNAQVQSFLELCEEIQFPVSLEENSLGIHNYHILKDADRY